jgi:hypothetical protein
LIDTDLTAAELDIVAIEADIGTVGATSLQGQIDALDLRLDTLEAV